MASVATTPSPLNAPSQHPTAPAPAGVFPMREGTTTMNRTSVTLTLLAMGLLLVLALLS